MKTLLIAIFMLSATLSFSQVKTPDELIMSNPTVPPMEIMGDWQWRWFSTSGDKTVVGPVEQLFINEVVIRISDMDRKGNWSLVEQRSYEWDGSSLVTRNDDGKMILFSCETFKTMTRNDKTFNGLFIRGEATVNGTHYVIFISELRPSDR
jgi:hypothetical protein